MTVVEARGFSFGHATRWRRDVTLSFSESCLQCSFLHTWLSVDTCPTTSTYQNPQIHEIYLFIKKKRGAKLSRGVETVFYLLSFHRQTLQLNKMISSRVVACGALRWRCDGVNHFKRIAFLFGRGCWIGVGPDWPLHFQARVLLSAENYL